MNHRALLFFLWKSFINLSLISPSKGSSPSFSFSSIRSTSYLRVLLRFLLFLLFLLLLFHQLLTGDLRGLLGGQ